VARFERTCQLLRRLNELREQQCELLKEKFRLTLHLQVESEVQLRLQQSKEHKIKTNPQVDLAKENVAENQVLFRTRLDFVISLTISFKNRVLLHPIKMMVIKCSEWKLNYDVASVRSSLCL
jgi:hypothetical protein